MCSVALCAALIVAVSCAMASLNKAVETRIEETVGAADARVDRRRSVVQTFEYSVAAGVSQWPDVALAVPKLQRGADAIGRPAASSPTAAPPAPPAPPTAPTDPTPTPTKPPAPSTEP
ncbi:MAG: hypothetical protein K2X32_09475, partial [Phycisphaerales bacterium]|nr:hypothetical protein [Phycisphaerales bacterium]